MNKHSRRSFLKKSSAVAAGAVGFPYFVRPAALGKNGAVSASNRITAACIGLGWMGPGNMNNMLGHSQCQVVAVCDLEDERVAKYKDHVNNHYNNNSCEGYKDFREIMVRDDIDAVMLALPDHWHSIPAIMAAENGKDIYGEKPFSHTLREGRAMVEAVENNGRVWQTGSWQRSRSHFHRACELVRNGVIGKLKHVEVGLPSGFYGPKDETIKEPPAGLDYDMWLGPAPYAPYCEARVHVNWRWHLDYGGGQLLDWIGHHLDIAHWGLGLDETGPVEIEGTGEFPKSGLWNAVTKYRVKTKYANGVEMIIAGGYGDIAGGTKWIGENGYIHVNRGFLRAEPESLLNEKIGPNDIRLYKAPDHMGNFLDCIKTRRKTSTPAETAHRSASVGHLGLTSILVGRKIKFDPVTETILNDPQATALLGKSMRSPWHI